MYVSSAVNSWCASKEYSQNSIIPLEANAIILTDTIIKNEN